MQAFKLKGEIDEAGRLIVSEPVDLIAGKVEVIILSFAEPDAEENRSIEPTAEPTSGLIKTLPETSSFESFMDWFTEGVTPVSPEFDADDAKWQYLKGKNHL